MEPKYQVGERVHVHQLTYNGGFTGVIVEVTDKYASMNIPIAYYVKRDNSSNHGYWSEKHVTPLIDESEVIEIILQ